MRVTASKTLRLPHVQEYMQQRVRESIGLNATIASKKILDLAQSAKSEYVQLEASKDILDRAGYKPVDEMCTRQYLCQHRPNLTWGSKTLHYTYDMVLYKH